MPMREDELTILCVVGTRPEAIKIAPVVLALRREPWAKVRVLATAQHREMLDQVLGPFDIQADVDLDLMQSDQKLPELTSRLLTAIDHGLERECPDLVLAQGDTTTVLATALACFYRHIPFGHVEAGLRTRNLASPFPEEMNRTLVGRLARLHFAPTEGSRANLLREGVPDSWVHLTGNTVIDAVLPVAARSAPVGVKLDAAKRLRLIAARISAVLSSTSAALSGPSPISTRTFRSCTPSTATRMSSGLSTRSLWAILASSCAPPWTIPRSSRP